MIQPLKYLCAQIILKNNINFANQCEDIKDIIMEEAEEEFDMAIREIRAADHVIQHGTRQNSGSARLAKRSARPRLGNAEDFEVITAENRQENFPGSRLARSDARPGGEATIWSVQLPTAEVQAC